MAPPKPIPAIPPIQFGSTSSPSDAASTRPRREQSKRTAATIDRGASASASEQYSLEQFYNDYIQKIGTQPKRKLVSWTATIFQNVKYKRYAAALCHQMEPFIATTRVICLDKRHRTSQHIIFKIQSMTDFREIAELIRTRDIDLDNITEIIHAISNRLRPGTFRHRGILELCKVISSKTIEESFDIDETRLKAFNNALKVFKTTLKPNVKYPVCHRQLDSTSQMLSRELKSKAKALQFSPKTSRIGSPIVIFNRHPNVKKKVSQKNKYSEVTLAHAFLDKLNHNPLKSRRFGYDHLNMDELIILIQKDIAIFQTPIPTGYQPLSDDQFDILMTALIAEYPRADQLYTIATDLVVHQRWGQITKNAAGIYAFESGKTPSQYDKSTNGKPANSASVTVNGEVVFQRCARTDSTDCIRQSVIRSAIDEITLHHDETIPEGYVCKVAINSFMDSTIIKPEHKYLKNIKAGIQKLFGTEQQIALSVIINGQAQSVTFQRPLFLRTPFSKFSQNLAEHGMRVSREENKASIKALGLEFLRNLTFQDASSTTALNNLVESNLSCKSSFETFEASSEFKSLNHQQKLAYNAIRITLFDESLVLKII